MPKAVIFDIDAMLIDTVDPIPPGSKPFEISG
jgi:beta-phosphoglucomutase-like phosphatase (HAD superfamily)